MLECVQKIKSLADFIEASRSVNGDKYDYSETVFIKMKTPVILKCKQCGAKFTEMPTSHLNSAYIDNYKNRDGCRFCHSGCRQSAAYFIKKAREVHGQEYDYSKVKGFEKYQEKVEIIHKKCGRSIFQTKNGHLRGDGCKACNSGLVRNKEEFIKEAIAIHGDAYDYSEIDYIDTSVDVELKCNDCECKFWDRPSNHLHAHKTNKTWVSRCPNCKDYSKALTKEKFVEMAVAMHADKYDYSEVEYVRSILPVKIKCNECGTKFEQRPNGHLATRKNNLGGCPQCSYVNPSSESKGEKTIAKYLTDRCIKFVRQYTNISCKNDKNKALRFDFYIPELNLLIEYDGEQHFKPIKYWGGQKNFEKLQVNDKIKENWAKENGLNFVRFKYDDFCVDMLNNIIQKYILLNKINPQTPYNNMSHIDDLL